VTFNFKNSSVVTNMVIYMAMLKDQVLADQVQRLATAKTFRHAAAAHISYMK